jgi:alpha-1,6-mannosyltransferase
VTSDSPIHSSTRAPAGRFATLTAGRGIRRQRDGASEREGISRTPPQALLLGLLLIGATVWLIIDAADGKSPLLPPSPSMTKWLEGLGSTLTFHIFLICLLVFTCAYAGLVYYAGRITPLVAIALVAIVNVVVFVGPVLISTDVFSYIAYARMAVVHGVNPYTHGPHAIAGDPIYKYVGTDWLKATSAYGPLYTLISYPIAPLGKIASVWGMKVEALLASTACFALTWRCAKQRGLNPVPALLVVGANPLWVIYGFGGEHNDLIMIAFMLAAVTFALGERDVRAGTSIMLGAFIKATAVAILPFMLVGRRRPKQLLGAILGLVFCVVLGYALFGAHGVDIVTVLRKDSSYVSSDGFPTIFMHLLGKPGVYPVDHVLLTAGMAVVLAYLLWRTWRGYDWVAASGWAMLTIAVTSPWLLAWYTLWGLPLSVIVRDRRLMITILIVQGLYIAHQLAPLFSPVILT